MGRGMRRPVEQRDVRIIVVFRFLFSRISSWVGGTKINVQANNKKYIYTFESSLFEKKKEQH